MADTVEKTSMKSKRLQDCKQYKHLNSTSSLCTGFIFISGNMIRMTELANGRLTKEPQVSVFHSVNFVETHHIFFSRVIILGGIRPSRDRTFWHFSKLLHSSHFDEQISTQKHKLNIKYMLALSFLPRKML